MKTNTKSQTSKSQFNSSQTAQFNLAAAIVEALHELNTAEAEALATQIVEKSDEASGQIEKATSQIDSLGVLSLAKRTADKDIKATIAGVYAIAEQVSPTVLELLPSRADMAAFDSISMAGKLVSVLKVADVPFPALGQLVDQVRLANLAAGQKLEAEVGSQSDIIDGKVALTQLKMLCLQAEILIRQLSKPGSPAYDSVFKKPAKKKAAKKDPAKKAETKGTTPSAGNTAPAASGGPVNPPTPAPAPANGAANGASHA